MLLVLTAKIKILPNAEEQKLLQETMRAYTDACNFVSAHVFATHNLSQASLNKALYRSIRDNFDLRSQMAQSVLKTVIAKYKTIQANESKGIRIKPKFKHPEYDLVWNRDYYLVKDIFSVNTLQGRIKLNFKSGGMEQYFDGSWKFGTAKLVTKHGKWFLHIPMSKEIDILADADVANVVGIDLGINYIAAAYDSKGKTNFYNGKTIKHRRGHYKALRKQLQQRKTPSARRRLKAIGSRENRWMQDVNHCVSKALVESQPTKTLFVLEDLTGIRSATERVKLKWRYVSVSWAFFDLRQKLEYKAHMRGSKIIAINPRHTSQTCPKCGHTEPTNRNKRTHTFCCRNCSYQSNDDRIGAMNLYRKGIEYLADCHSAVAGE